MAGQSESNELLPPRRPRGLRVILARYFMGQSTERPYSADELRRRIGWNDEEKDLNSRRIEHVQNELRVTMDGLREQFAKIAALIALLALMLAFGLTGNEKELTTRVLCLAAVVAVWVQAPRFKVFTFRTREDSGLRIGGMKTQFDEFYYFYKWNCRREETLHTAEVLVFVASVCTIIALLYVSFAV